MNDDTCNFVFLILERGENCRRLKDSNTKRIQHFYCWFGTCVRLQNAALNNQPLERFQFKKF